LAAIPQDQSALLHETGRHVVNTPPTGPRPRLGNSLAYRLFESFLLAQDEPIPPVDMSTNEGKNRFIQVLQDFFQYAARRPESDGGIVRRGGLGLDMGNILTVLFPGFAGFTALVLSQRANSVPKQVRRPLGTFLRKGDLFWAVTNEWVADKHQELGDKSAPTNYGPILTAFRLQVVVDSDPDMLHVVYGRCRQFSGLEKIPDRQKWKNLRLLDESLPDNQPGNDSPHGNARVLVGDQWDNCMAINSLCHINVVEVQSITTMPWGWIYAGRLSGDALAMLDNLRKAYFNKDADIAPVPQGICHQAVCEGLRGFAPPIHPPRESEFKRAKHNPRHLFPDYKASVEPDWDAQRTTRAQRSRNPYQGYGQQRRPGDRAQDRGRQDQRDTYGRTRPNSHPRPRTRSRSPRPRDDHRRARSRDDRHYRPENYEGQHPRRHQDDRPAETRLGDHVHTRPVFHPVNNVMQDGRYQPQVYHNHASRDPDDDRNRERGYYEDDGGRGMHEQGGEYQNGDLLNYG